MAVGSRLATSPDKCRRPEAKQVMGGLEGQTIHLTHAYALLHGTPVLALDGVNYNPIVLCCARYGCAASGTRPIYFEGRGSK